MALVKWSICVFINHLSPTAVHRHVDMAFRSTIGLWLVSATVLSIFQCALPRPWDYANRSGCTNRVSVISSSQGSSRPVLIQEASLVDLRRCLKHGHGVWIRFPVRVDHRQAPHVCSEKNYSSSCVSDQVVVSFVLPCSQLHFSNLKQPSVIGAAAAQLAVFWNAYAKPDITHNLWLPTVCNQIVVFLSVLTACLPYLRPLMESLESGIVRVPEDLDELRSFARSGSRTN